MALPPQMAVPELIRYEAVEGILSNNTPMSMPTSIVPATDTMVNAIP